MLSVAVWKLIDYYMQEHTSELDDIQMVQVEKLLSLGIGLLIMYCSCQTFDFSISIIVI